MASREVETFKNGKTHLYDVPVEARDYSRVKRMFQELANELPTDASWDDFAATVRHAQDVLGRWRAIVDAKAAARGVRVVR